MNAKILYAATLALAVASSLAMAQESRPLTRAEVNKAWAEAAADGTLRKNDYDFDANDFKGPLDAQPCRGRRRAAGAAQPGADRAAGQPHLQPGRHGDAAGLDAAPGRRSRPRCSPPSATARCAAPTTTTKRVRRPPRSGAHAGPGPGRYDRYRHGQLSASGCVKAAFGRLFSGRHVAPALAAGRPEIELADVRELRRELGILGADAVAGEPVEMPIFHPLSRARAPSRPAPSARATIGACRSASDFVGADSGTIKGRGVYATRAHAEGEVVEACPVILFKRHLRRDSDRGSPAPVQLGRAGEHRGHPLPGRSAPAASTTTAIRRTCATKATPRRSCCASWRSGRSRSGEELTVNYSARAAATSRPRTTGSRRMAETPHPDW